MSRTPAERTAAAVGRARAERHQARLSGEGSVLLVKSHTRPGVTYRVGVRMMDGLVSFTCDHSQYDDDSSRHPERAKWHGWVPCKHGARAALRLQRRGLLRWADGHWLPTTRAYDIGAALHDESDPFAGLPGC